MTMDTSDPMSKYTFTTNPLAGDQQSSYVELAGRPCTVNGDTWRVTLALARDQQSKLVGNLHS
jgi:hypothetical protein